MNRRNVMNVLAASSGAALLLASQAPANAAAEPAQPALASEPRAPYAVAKDGTRLYVQDWGSGRPMLFVAAWALNSDFWGAHVMSMLKAGFRTLAYDRRGHGRSDAPPHGYDSDTLADDLATIIESRDLRNVVVVAHSMGAGEVVRYLTRHGAGRIAKLIFAAPTTPYLVRAADNTDAVPEEMLDGMLGAIAQDFPKWVRDNEPPFFTPDTDGETRAWIKAMMLSVPLPVAVTFRHAAGRTDFRRDLGAIATPTLILHGDRDASAPLALTGAKTAKLIHGAKLVVYEGAPHALPLTHRDRFIADTIAFGD
jgi:non-heme chloroperoxidase